MKKFLFSLPVLGVVGSAFAEGANSGAAFDGSVAQTIVSDSANTLTNFLTGAGTVVAGVIVAGLTIWGAIALVGIVKKAFSTGKGR